MTVTETVAALARFAQPVPVPPTPLVPVPPGPPVPTGSPVPSGPADPGLPDGWLVRFFQDPGGHIGAVPGWLWRTVQAHWPLLVWSAVLIVVAAVLVAVLVGWAWRRLAQRGVWLEITAPAKLPTEGAVALWQALAGMVTRSRWRVPRPGLVRGLGRLSVEFIADERGVRAGVWVPRATAADRVALLIPRVLPGARVSRADVPEWTGMRVSATERFTHAEWTPLLDPSPRVLRPATEIGDERLGVVLDALALRTQSGDVVAGVQLVVSRQPRTRRGSRAGSRSWVHAVVWAPARLLIAVVDVVTNAIVNPNKRYGSSAERASSQRSDIDPVVAAEQRARDAKRANGPHLRVTVRVWAATRTGSGARVSNRRRAVVSEVAAGYDVVTRSTMLRYGRVWHARTKVMARVPGRGFAATVPEAAVLWHLPPEPSRYSMAASTARQLAPARDLPRVADWDGDGDA